MYILNAYVLENNERVPVFYYFFMERPSYVDYPNPNPNGFIDWNLVFSWF